MLIGRPDGPNFIVDVLTRVYIFTLVYLYNSIGLRQKRAYANGGHFVFGELEGLSSRMAHCCCFCCAPQLLLAVPFQKCYSNVQTTSYDLLRVATFSGQKCSSNGCAIHPSKPRLDSSRLYLVMCYRYFRHQYDRWIPAERNESEPSSCSGGSSIWFISARCYGSSNERI